MKKSSMTGAEANVLVCPECGEPAQPQFDLGTGELYLNARAKYRCWRMHWFDKPASKVVGTYDPDLIGKI